MCEFTADSMARSQRDSTPNFAPPENFVHVDMHLDTVDPFFRPHGDT